MMSTTLKKLFHKDHALEYLSLDALKMLREGQRSILSKRTLEAGVNVGAKVGFKEEYDIKDSPRSEMIENLGKRKKIIFNFEQWIENPKNDALVLVRIPACTCIEEMDPQTGTPILVYYCGTPENNQKNVFMVLIGIIDFTGPYQEEPGRRFTRTTTSEAFKLLIGPPKGFSPSEINNMIVTSLKQREYGETQTINALGVVNIVDYSIKGSDPWILGNIIYMVRDRGI